MFPVSCACALESKWHRYKATSKYKYLLSIQRIVDYCWRKPMRNCWGNSQTVIMLSFQAIGLALMLLAPFNGAEFIRVCGLDQVSIVAITKDQTGQYVFVNDRAMVNNGPTSSPSNFNRRLLRQQEQQQQQHSFEAAISVQQQQSRSLQSNSSSFIYVRECICSYSEVK